MPEGPKSLQEAAIQMPEMKVAADSATMSGPLVEFSGVRERKLRLKADVAHVTLRLLCLVSSVVSLSLMVTAEQSATISVIGFDIPVYSKWSYSDSFE